MKEKVQALVIEDEFAASQALIATIGETAPEIEVIDVLQTVEESCQWFASHPMPDLVFMDIHLADGSSFGIFDCVDVTCPIIFTTAYDEYALQAFKVNSIDYLLKPIAKNDIRRAIDKLRNMRAQGQESINAENIARAIQLLRQRSSPAKRSFLIAVKDKLIPVSAKDIAYIHIETKIVKAHTFAGAAYVLDQSMDSIAAELDADIFFRANRQYIVNRHAIKDISIWFSSKLAVNLTLPTPERILVSRTNARELKKWLER